MVSECIATDGRKMTGVGTMKKEGSPWEADLSLSYVRVDS